MPSVLNTISDVDLSRHLFHLKSFSISHEQNSFVKSLAMGVPIWKPSDQLDCDNANSKRRRVESTSQESHQARLRNVFVRTSTARGDGSEGDSINLENTQNNQEESMIPMRPHVFSDYREASFRIPSSFF